MQRIWFAFIVLTDLFKIYMYRASTKKSETAKSQKLEVKVYSYRRKSLKFWKSQGKIRSK